MKVLKVVFLIILFSISIFSQVEVVEAKSVAKNNNEEKTAAVGKESVNSVTEVEFQRIMQIIGTGNAYQKSAL